MAQDINFGYVHGIIIEKVVLDSTTFFLPQSEVFRLFSYLLGKKKMLPLSNTFHI